MNHAEIYISFILLIISSFFAQSPIHLFSDDFCYTPEKNKSHDKRDSGVEALEMLRLPKLSVLRRKR